MDLGRLKRVELREAWKHEASHFTNWLAEEENLKLLGDEAGLDIRLIQTEASVGKFSVDILAEEENTGKKIIIENQLEMTDHDHLGKIITYASGYDANYVLWVVKDVREEHRRAVDWLNEHTDEGVAFYLIRVELWQIADSPLAPKFEIMSRPNNWAKAVKESVSENVSETKLKQLEFWTRFKEFAQRKGSKVRMQKSYPQHWSNISIGSGYAHVSLTNNSRDGLFGVELYIPDDKELYMHLLAHKDVIESELHQNMEWMELPNKKASRVRILRPGNLDDQNEWENYFTWLLSQTESFARVFPKYLKL